MVDESPDFSSRLDAALAMNGLDNAAFAAKLGIHGQQHVHQWRKRGRIGSPSVPKVRDVLPLTDMEWLMYGTGVPRRTVVVSGPKGRDFQSYLTRIDPRILAKAVRVLTSDEFVNGTRAPLSAAIFLLQTCDQLASGEAEADLIESIYGKGNGDVEFGKEDVG